MANIRTLLRNEKAARRINHPQASYSSAGTLICLACQLQIKSESLWATHLTSSRHLARLQQPRTQPQAITADTRDSVLTTPLTNSSTNNGKKRKAEDNEEAVDVRKKSRPFAGSAEDPVDEIVELDEPEHLAHQPSGITTHNLPSRPSTALPLSPKANEVDEDEWAAFERDVATPPPDLRPSALNAVPTISAVPLTAEEIAKRAREESSTQAKERQEAELEDEKEDAARRLEEEFDEMDELEARVRRLREQREELRRNASNKPTGQFGFREDANAIGSGDGGGGGDEEENDAEEADDEEDWDTWIR